MKHWPLFGLRLRTPRLELRLPGPKELDELADTALDGVHPSDEMPFATPWTHAPREELGGRVVQWQWKMLAEWTPENWHLPLAVVHEGRAIGVQELHGRDFAVVREVSSGSWLGLRHQRRGLGTEMRAAVLELAFTGLGARFATTGAHAGNLASQGVTRRLGYRPNGVTRSAVLDRPVEELRFVLDRDGWLAHRRVETEIEGLPPCLPRFGLTGDASGRNR
ncbi:GNAT family N-acetyltransferase [Actinocorallia populi]|uniref:GNAT family N-acetyltransferase n=1 Tax=Actinocorallia populi TaxID=2079200 RepID=UPI000D0909D5|nr:GNAT family protein [Actinocorallia populi]